MERSAIAGKKTSGELHLAGEAMDGAAQIVNGVGFVNDVSDASELRLPGERAGDFTGGEDDG